MSAKSPRFNTGILTESGSFPPVGCKLPDSLDPANISLFAGQAVFIILTGVGEGGRFSVVTAPTGVLIAVPTEIVREDPAL